MQNPNSKHIVCTTKKDNVILTNIGDFLEYYTRSQREKPKNKLIILYLSSEDELVGENHMIEVSDAKSLFINILSCVFAFQAVKLAVLRSEPTNVLLPTQEDMLIFSKLQIFTHLIDIELKDYLVLTEESYHSFSLHHGIRSYF